MLKKLFIKNMVCNRCIQVVEEDLSKAGYKVMDIKLGEVLLADEFPDEDIPAIKEMLEKRGFELLEDKSRKLIERIKNLTIEIIHQSNTALKVNYSSFFEKEIGRDYKFLSTLFSSVEGITIEHYIILQKIEKVKELLIYDELTLSEISYQLNYSSVQHLSNQFKKTSGMSPSSFKKLKKKSRKPLDQLTDK